MLSKFSVKKPMTIVVSVVLVLLLGFVSFTKMTTDLFPSIDFPYAIVMTSYPGASPEEVEMVVTKPVEQAMATLNNIKNVSSTSSENVSMVILQFEDKANMDSVTIDIREKLDLISSYWDDSVGSSTILKLNPDMMPVMVSAIDMEGLSNAEVSSYVKEKIIPQIESIEGVASVSLTGLVENQVNVVLSQDKIDKVNDKIKTAVEKQLDDAEGKMDEAKTEIQSGKSDLEDRIKQFNDGMNLASQGISDGKSELLKKEVELNQLEKELTAKETELSTGKSELKTQETNLLKTEKDLNKKEKEAKSGLETINTSLSQLEATLELLKNDEAANKEQIVTTEKAISELNKQKTAIESGLKEIEAGKTQITSGKKEIKTAKEKFKKAETPLKSARTQLDAGKTALEEAKNSIKVKENELDTQKNEVGNELNNAQLQLVDGEKELDSQKTALEDSRQDVIDKADVTKTITMDMISNILSAQNFSMPAGYVTEEGIDYLVRVGDKITSEDEIKDLVLFDPGLDDVDPILLSDVADVFNTSNANETYAKVNGNDAVILSIQKQNTYSTADVSNRIEKRLESISSENNTIHVNNLMDQGLYINMVVQSVLNNLIFGAILAILILFLFLRDLKPTFIIACSIPISVIAAIVLMYFSGITLNIISLSGLAVGVGMLVDNSVVVIENIYRLRQKGVSAVKAAVSGAVQVAGAITASTLTTVCVFLPIVFVEGITRQLFVDMALTVAYSLLASLVVAITLVPAMSSRMLKNTKDKEHKWFDGFVRGYEKVVRIALRKKTFVLIGAIAILVLSVVLAMSRGTAFMPTMDSTQVSINVTMPEGTIFEDTVEMADTILGRIQSIEDVETVGAMIGGNEMAMMGGGSNSGQSITLYAILKEDKKHSSEYVANDITKKCSDLDCEITATGSSMDMSALGGSGVSIHVKGLEIDELKNIATNVAEKLSTVEGLENISDGMENPTPELKIIVNKEKAMLEGLTVAQAYMEIKKGLSAESEATKITMESKEYPVVVVDEKAKELTRDNIRNYTFEVTGMDGKSKKIAIKDIADVMDTSSLSSITRSSGERYLTVSATLKKGYNIGLVSQKAESIIKSIQVPNGYAIEFDGENETIMESMTELVKMLLLAVAFIYLIMVAQFQSLLSPFIVMFTIPLAFTGGLLGLFITGNEVSVISMIGFVMLAGIIVNNGIVLVDYINQLRAEGMDKKEAIVEAGKTRMRPILMTALTTIFGLCTMAFGVGMGADMMQPIAIVTIGGLLYATITTLFVVPVLYDVLNRKELKVVSEEELEIIDE